MSAEGRAKLWAREKIVDPRNCKDQDHYDIACRCGKYLLKRTCNAQFVRLGWCVDCARKNAINAR